MSPSEIRQVAEAMRDCGIQYLKCGDLIMSCQAPRAVASAPAEKHPLTPTQPGPSLSPEQEKEIEHKVEALESIMKLSDEALIGRLFPEPEAPKDDP